MQHAVVEVLGTKARQGKAGLTACNVAAMYEELDGLHTCLTSQF